MGAKLIVSCWDGASQECSGARRSPTTLHTMRTVLELLLTVAIAPVLSAQSPNLVRWCDPKDANKGPAPCAPGNSSLGGGILGRDYDMVLHTSRSMHPGGVTATLCDGSVRFISESISLQVWQDLGTPAGGEPIPGNSF